MTEGTRCACDKYLVYRDGLCWKCWNAKREGKDPAAFVAACIEGDVEHTVEWTKPVEKSLGGEKAVGFNNGNDVSATTTKEEVK